MVYQDYASLFTELLEKDNLTTIYNRNIQLLASTAVLWLKRKTEFKRNNVKTIYNRTETLTFLGPRIWEIVPDYIE